MRGMGKRRPRVLGEKKTDLITSPLADSSDHCHAIAPMTPNYFHSPIFSFFFFLTFFPLFSTQRILSNFCMSMKRIRTLNWVNLIHVQNPVGEVG